MRAGRWILLGLALAGIAGGALAWLSLFGAEPLARFAARRLAERPDAALTPEFDRIRGNLLREVTVEGLRLADRRDSTVVTVETLTLRWNPMELLRGRLSVAEVVAVNPGVRLAPPSAPATPEPGGEPPAGGGPRIPLAIRIGLVRVEGGSFESAVAGARFSLRGLHGMARFDPADDVWDVRLERGLLEAGGRSLPLRSLTLRASLSAGVQRVELAEIAAGTSHVGVSGVWSGGERSLDAKVELHPLQLEDVARIAGVDLPLRGEVVGDLAAAGRTDSMAVSARLEGRPSRGDSVSVALAGSVVGDRLELESLRARLGAGAVEGRGWLRRDDARYGGEFHLDDLTPLAWLFDRPPALSLVLRGDLTVEGRGLEPGERSTRAELRLARSEIGPIEVDAARVLAVKSPDGAVQAEFLAKEGADSLGGRVALAPDRTLEGDVLLRLGDGRALGPLLGGRSVRAGGEVRGRAAGELRRPRFLLEGELHDVAMERLGARTVGFALTWDPERGESVAAELRAESLAVNGVAVEEISLRLAGTARSAAVQQLHVRRGPVELTAAGRLARASDGFSLTLAPLELRTGERRWTMEGPVRVTSARETVRIEPFRLASGNAAVEGSGTLRGDSLQLSLLLAGLELRDLGEIRPLGGTAAGELSAELEVRGARRDPQGEGRVELAGGVVHGMPLRRMGARVSFGEGELRVHEGVVECAGGTVGFTGAMPLGRDGWRRARFQARSDDLRLSSLRPLWAALEQVEGRADLVLSVENPASPRAELAGVVRELVIAGLQPGEVQVRATLEDSLLQVAELAAAGEAGRARISGSIPVSVDLTRGRFARREGDARGTLFVENGDLAVVPKLTSSLAEGAGRFSGEVRFEGRLEDPLLYGEAAVSGGELVLRGLRDRFYGVTGRLAFDGRDIRLENVRGREGAQGKIALSGTARMERYKIEDYRIDIRGSDYEPTSWHDVSGRMRGDVRLRPNRLSTGKVVPHLEGRIDVDYLVYRRRFENQAEYGPAAAPPGQLAIPVTVTLDLETHADDNVYLENQDVRMEVSGDIVARYDEAGLQMLGSLTSTRGQYFLFHHVFEIRRGVFTFREVSTLDDVDLDVQADTEVGGERIDVVITGSLRDPRVEASSESGLSETEIFRALTVGYRAPDPDGGGASFTQGLVDSWRDALVERLGGQFARGIGIDRVGFRTDPSAGEAARLELGKRLRNDLYLNFQYAIRSDRPDDRLASWELQNPERLLSLEYRLSERFSLDGEAGTVEGLEFLNLDLKYRLSY